MPGHEHLSVCEALPDPGSALFAARVGLIARGGACYGHLLTGTIGRRSIRTSEFLNIGQAR
jgi:hypothetical protein